MYSLSTSFWMVPPSSRNAALVGHCDVEREQRRRRRVDGHGRGDLVERQPVEQDPHVLDRVDGHAHAADLAARTARGPSRAHLGGQIEGHAEPGLALLEQELVATVGLGRSGKAGILAHGPEAAAVHGLLHAAGVGRLPGRAQVALGVEPGLGQIGGLIHLAKDHARVGREPGLALLFLHV